MGLKRIAFAINRLLEFWEKQNISTQPKTKQEIDDINNNFLNFPSDFIEFYSKTNGMEILYPNEMDEEGFLFYPIEAVTPVIAEFDDSNLLNKEQILLFAEYMHKSWWYGIEMISGEQYVIGIISDKNSFKPITNSLAEFIELYLENSSKLYDYS